MANLELSTQLTIELKERFKNIKLLVLDVDGVMTDGGLTIGDDGLEYKTFHAHDGLGMKLLKATGVELAIITGRTSNIVKQRAESTGVAHFYQGAADKLVAFKVNLLTEEMSNGLFELIKNIVLVCYNHSKRIQNIKLNAKHLQIFN